MIETFQILATLAAAQVVIAMTPDPNRSVVLDAGRRGPRHGLAAAAGSWPVGLLYATFGLLGVGTVTTALPETTEAIRLAGGLHLAWLGCKAVRHAFTTADPVTADPPRPTSIGEAFRAGTIAHLTNPLAIAYFMAIFSVTDAAMLSPSGQALAIVMMPTLSFLWHATLALVVANPPVAEDDRSWLDRFSGPTMTAFGVRLLAERN